MFATVVTTYRGQTRVSQFETPTIKDCLVAWAGRVDVEGMTDEARTALRGKMADFNAASVNGLKNVWRLQSDLGLGGTPEATVLVIATDRH